MLTVYFHTPKAAMLAIHEACSLVIGMSVELDWSCGKKIAE